MGRLRTDVPQIAPTDENAGMTAHEAQEHAQRRREQEVATERGRVVEVCGVLEEAWQGSGVDLLARWVREVAPAEVLATELAHWMAALQSARRLPQWAAAAEGDGEGAFARRVRELLVGSGPGAVAVGALRANLDLMGLAADRGSECDAMLRLALGGLAREGVIKWAVGDEHVVIEEST